jgi:hypothetical protein
MFANVIDKQKRALLGWENLPKKPPKLTIN